MIPCYSEPVEVIEETVQAALDLAYPVDRLRVLVLDDGNNLKRPDLAYIARTKMPGVPHHAKAGNLNHAIFCGKTDGDFIAVLDADMICVPGMLDNLLAPFYPGGVRDEGIGMVSSPQDFYAVRPGDTLSQRETFQYDVVLPSWDGHGCCPGFGTNVAYSRAALQRAGGFATGSVTEDFFTSVRILAAGYRSAYVSEHLAYGLVPPDLDGYMKQRGRWSAGSIQVLLAEPPFFNPGLRFSHRIIYGMHAAGPIVAVIANLYQAFVPFALLIDPAIVAGTGKPAIFVCLCLASTLFYLLAYWAAAAQALGSVTEGLALAVSQWRHERYMLACHFKAAATALLGIKLEFAVTRKDGVASPLSTNLPHIIWHVSYMVASAAVVAWALAAGRLGTFEGAAAAGMLLALAYALLPPVAAVFEKPYTRTFTDFAEEELGKGARQ
ncbi:nucleotide-diphospho-sugar transferase [Hyaloraphidium curvatum]|nr:nucleotide-diphospho-sugar transferase [Hyaloraphidium curvatum]